MICLKSKRFFRSDGPPVHSPHFILAAASFPEVGDGGQLCVNGLTIEPSIVEVHDRFLCVLLTPKLDTDDTHV